MSEKVRAMEVFWTQEDESEMEDPLVFVKGLSSGGNRRPIKSSGVSAKKPKTNMSTNIKTSKSKKTANQPKSLPMKGKKEIEPTKDREKDKVSSGQNQKKVSLRDLRAEDKQRVANLIQELARIGEEKENVVEQLYTQRHEYDQYIKNLLDQQEMIVKERENVMKQLHECQVMLSNYQKAMTDEKVHEARTFKKKENKEFVFKPKMVPITSEGIQTDSYVDCGRRKSIEKSTITEDTELTPGGTRRRSRLPSAEAGFRPFTNMIDQLIEHEKSSMASPVSSIRPSSSANSLSSKSSNAEHIKKSVKTDEIAKGKLFGIGPLPAPILSSTHTSDLVSNATNSPSLRHQSRTKAQDFAPISVDATESLSIRSEEVGAISEKSVEGERNGFHTPTKCKTDRLEAEKQSLLKEQEKLKEIIAEQQKRMAEPTLAETAQLKHLPNLAENKVTFNSPVYQELADGSDQEMLKYYSELSPGKRQEEMNAQKEALMLEQQRLKEILAEQEVLLKTKQEQLHHQQQLQRHRLEVFQETGYFPPFRGKDALLSSTSGGQGYEYMASQPSSIATSNVPNTITSTSSYNSDSCSSHYLDSHHGAFEVRSDIGAVFHDTKPYVMETRSDNVSPTAYFRRRKSQTGSTKKQGTSIKSRELLNRNDFLLNSSSTNAAAPVVKSRNPLQSLADIIDEVESLHSQPSTTSPGSRDMQSVQSCQSEALNNAQFNNAALTELLNDDAVRDRPGPDGSHAELEESQLLDDVFFVHK